jgi:hypothetical protein
MDAKVKFDEKTGFEHTFDYANAPLAIGNWCYGQLDAGITLNEYEFEEEDRDFLEKGTLRKFDQTHFAESLGLDEIPELSEHGFYYIPTAC